MTSEPDPGHEPGSYGASPWPLSVKPNRRRWPWVVAGPAVLVVVLVSIFVMSRDDGPDQATDAASTSPTPAPSPTPSPSPTPTPSETPSPSSSPTPTATGSAQGPDRFRCWDDKTVRRLKDCSGPEGRAGLEHVFPSLIGPSCRERDGRTSIGLVLVVRCTGELDDGTELTVEYSQWESVEDGTDFFDDQGLTRGDAAGLLGWSGKSGKRFNAAFLYRREPLSASWFASTEEGLGSALTDGLVEARPAGEVRGEPIT